ncbi:MAG: hypothetical protein ACK5K7_06595, partial [Bacilli bacterium]
DSDVTKSAKFVLSNKYFNKKDSIKIIEYYVKNGERKTLEIGKNVKEFLKEVVKSSRSGYMEDVLKKVNYLDSGRKITGKCGKVLCSKEYNNHIANVVTGGVGAKGDVEYGKIVRDRLRFVAKKVEDDLDKWIKDNDYIIKLNVDNIKRYAKDLESCGERSYNLIDKANKLDWFVGGDEKKILALQKKINSQNSGTKIKEDGVYGKETEKAWTWYVEEAVKLVLLPAPLKVKYAFDNYNFVIGYGGYLSGHFMGGGTGGFMIYIDDDYNVAIMWSVAGEGSTNIEVSAGVKGEISFDAENVNSMAGNSATFGGGVGTPLVEVGINGGYSRSADGKTTSYSGGISGGASALPIGVSGGVSHNGLITEFNPVTWLKENLNIK